MKTGYIRRWTEDAREDVQQERRDNACFYDGSKGELEQGLGALAADLEH